MVALIPVLALFLMFPFVMSVNQAATQARMTAQLMEKQTANKYILEGALEYLLAWLSRHKDEVGRERFNLRIPLGGQWYLIDLIQARQTMIEDHLGKQPIKQQAKQEQASMVRDQKLTLKSAERVVKLEAVVRNGDGSKIGTIAATIEQVVGQESHQALLLNYLCQPAPNSDLP